MLSFTISVNQFLVQCIHAIIIIVGSVFLQYLINMLGNYTFFIILSSIFHLIFFILCTQHEPSTIDSLITLINVLHGNQCRNYAKKSTTVASREFWSFHWFNNHYVIFRTGVMRFIVLCKAVLTICIFDTYLFI